jgi:integrase
MDRALLVDFATPGVASYPRGSRRKNKKMTAKLTPITVANAKPRQRAGAPIRTEIHDRGCPGLFLIVQPSGAKSWALRYRVAGKSRKLTIGGAEITELSLAAARTAASQAKEQIVAGHDPAAEKHSARKPATDAIDHWVAEFIERHVRAKTRKNSQALTEHIFRNVVLSAWSGRPLQSIERRDVIDLVEDVARERPVLANRTLAALSKFFAWLKARDIIKTKTEAPTKGVERPYKEKRRERVLHDEELRQLWIVAGDPELGLGGTFLRLLLLTGARRDEISAMPWSELDIDKRLWKLPAERAKNDRANVTPLSDTAWRILDALPRNGDYVLGTGASHFMCYNRLKRKLGARLNFAEPWTFHDLRRSVASGLQRIGTHVEVIEAILNHRSNTFRGIVGVYQLHDYMSEKAVALAKWAEHLERLAGEEPAKVLPFPSRG